MDTSAITPEQIERIAVRRVKAKMGWYCHAAIWLYAMSNMALAQVGMQNFQVGSMPVTLVYPTQETVKSQSFGAFQIDAALNAKPSAGNQQIEPRLLI